jgi:hypothetical protein
LQYYIALKYTDKSAFRGQQESNHALFNSFCVLLFGCCTVCK